MSEEILVIGSGAIASFYSAFLSKKKSHNHVMSK